MHPITWMVLVLQFRSSFAISVFGDQRLAKFQQRRLTAEGCQSAGNNAQRGGRHGAEALKLCPSLRCFPLTDIPRP